MNFRRPSNGRPGGDANTRRSDATNDRRPRSAPPGNEPDCSLKRQCGNCRFVNTPYETGLQTKYDAGLKILGDRDVLGRARLLGATPALHRLNYRTVAKLAIRAATPARIAEARDNHFSAEIPFIAPRFSMGLFARESHRVVDIDSCPLHVHDIRRLLPKLREELDLASELLPYDEAQHSGDLRYVIIRSAHLTGEMSVVFVSRTSEPKNIYKKIVSQLRLKGYKIACAFINVNEAKTNAIWGPTTEQIYGQEGLRESLCGLSFEISPLSFFQVNPWQAETIYRRIASLVGPHAKQGVAWDLYSGVGQITLNLAREGYRVLGVEEVAPAAEDARKNAERNNLGKNAEFISGRSEDVLAGAPAWAKNPEVIVVNPSRRGIDASVLGLIAAQLNANPLCRLVYLSCDVTTLARDLAVLRSKGLRLRQAEAFDMFPQTEELEWLAVVTI